MLKKFLSIAITSVMLLSIGSQRVSATEPIKNNVKMYMNNEQHTGVTETKAVNKFNEVKWKFKTNGRIYSSPIIKDNVSFIGSNDNNFYAIDIRTGKELWRFETNGPVNSTAAIYDNKAFFTCGDGYFYAVNILDGKLIWKFKTNGESTKDIWDYYLSSPVVYKDKVFFGSGDTNIYALDAQNGSLLWSYKTSGIVHASPAINDDTLYCGSYDGNMYAINAITGLLKWKFKTVGDEWFPQGDIQGSPTIANGMVYFGSRDFNVYALNEKTGTGMWNFKVPGSWVSSTPSTKEVNGNKMLYFGTSDLHNFSAVSALMGEQNSELKWSISIPFNVFGGTTLVNDIGYFGGFDGRLYAVDLSNRQVLWTYQTEASKDNYSKIFDVNGKYTKEYIRAYETDLNKQYEMILSLGSILSTPAVENGVIYFGSTDGYVYAIQ